MKKENELSSEDHVIARAGDALLYTEDIEGIVPQGMSSEDSTDRISRYVHAWIRKQLLIKEAKDNISFDEAAIERKILDYRYSLMGYEYQSFFINKNLNKRVTDEEIVQYYNDHIDNFTLKQNIIRGRFVSMPINAPKTVKVSKLINSNKEKDIESLTNYCLSFATSYQLNDTLWINFDELIRATPLAQVENKVQLLKSRKFIQTSDSTNNYFLKISAYKITDERSPLEFVKNQIKNIIINKRKTILAKQLEEDVYQKAKKNNEIEVYEQK